MQYSIQGLNCDDPGRKDLLMDIGTEEMSHLEIVGTLAQLRDLLHAEKQLVKALPKMAKAARSAQLEALLPNPPRRDRNAGRAPE
jgi:Mn-containing catalase